MPDFAGSSVAVFEGRRVEEIARLITAQNGVVVSAPATRLQLLEAGPDVVELATKLRDEELDGMLFLSDTGVRHLPDVTAPVMGRSELIERLGKITLAARSPRVAAALAELGLVDARVPDPPHTWQSMVAAYDRAYGLAGSEIAFQESGIIHSRMHAELMDRGARVLKVGVYRWGLPEDLGPLTGAIERIAAGSVRVALFSAAAQIENVMAVASELDADEPLRDALRSSVVGAIGSLCVDRLRAFGIQPDVVPEHPRLEELVGQTARRAAEMLESG